MSIRRFLSGHKFAVVGASSDRGKFGNKLLRCYQLHQMQVTPINPRGSLIEGLASLRSLSELPEPGREECCVSVVTPPEITARVLTEAAQLGIKQIWLQPGSESPGVIRLAQELGLAETLIHSGPCLLVELGFDFIPTAAKEEESKL